MDRPALDYAINHLFLPPKLPQEDDYDVELQHVFLGHIAKCAEAFCKGLAADNVDHEIQTRWKLLRKSLDNFARIHGSGNLSKGFVQELIKGMESDDVLCLHIQSQNAGLILRRRKAEIFVEFFQASAPAALVTGTKGKLVIQYPAAPRLSIPIDPAFIDSFSGLLAELDCTTMPDAVPKTAKAGKKQEETRDVPDIRYISELVGGIARALTPVESIDLIASSTVYVTKRINDHVLWKSALLPWRRSPKWLLIRVVLQTTLAGWNLPEEYGYKAFITYILARTLESAVAKPDMSGDILFIMNAKIANRIWKLRSSFSPTLQSTSSFLIDSISRVISSVEGVLRRRWENVQALEARESTWVVPTKVEIDAALRFTLPRSSSFFETVKARGQALSTHTADFDRSTFEQRLEKDSHKQGAHSPGVSSPYLWFLILDWEKRMSSSSSDLGTLSDLSDRITYFDDMASSFKSRNPEIFSRIFLLVLELWVALDKLVTQRIRLLLDYPPELSITAFEPLLLPELSQMRRLHNIEIYFAERDARVRYHVSVFAHEPHTDSLPSRYFAGDWQMRSLRGAIHAEASLRKSEKIRELQEKSAVHASILREIGRLEHEYTRWQDRWGCWRSSHNSYCTRCTKQRQADDMRIMLFEWPLPEAETCNRHVVFELCVPEAFSIWRDTTYRLAQNHSSEPQEQDYPSPAVVLEDYGALKNHFVRPYNKQRIMIASTAKSFLQTHYRGHTFPCSQGDIIQNHPLRYRLWDRVAGKWLPSGFPLINIRSACTPDLPDPYKCLKWTMIDTIHASNNVIAQQSQCHHKLSYHEWENFGHLRAGVCLQWRNVIVQLISGVVDLASPAVHLLFQQAAWQAETASEPPAHYREAHFDLSDEYFGLQIVGVLEQRFASIAGNWKEGWTAATLVVVARRLFSLTPYDSVKREVLVLLSQLRQRLFIWMDDVLDLLNKSSGSAALSISRVDFVDRVLQLAASCRQTYAVGSTTSREIFRDSAALSIFIQCGIILHTNAPPNLSGLSPALRYLLERDVLIAVEALDHVDIISGNSDALDKAIMGMWKGFGRDSAPWRLVGEQWVTCVTSAESSDTQVRSVHLNLLSGNFLVDGQAQGTLPKEITNEPLFHLLFPNRSHWDIVPSRMKGMEYQLCDDMDGFQVHFKSGDELLIRIRDGSDFVSEFIAPKRLEGDFPRSLIVNMVHIFHEQSQSLDFYAAPSGWQPRHEASWRLDLTAQDSRFLRNTSDISEFVLDPVSSIAQQFSGTFGSLENCKTNLILSLRLGSRLHIKLPRYDLEFSAVLGGVHLESKELPGFYVSSVQSIGTLVGLQNKLVLRSVNGEMPKIFVPDGQVRIAECDTGHPRVTITPDVRHERIKILSYDIDDIAGRVVGDGSLVSWYQLALLHAATTSHLADPLLRRTGLYKAQEMLGSAQAFAFMSLESEHHAILQQFIDFLPVRDYYPPHLTSMETIEWHESLSVLFQCGRFVPLVNAILDYARKQALFHTSNQQSVLEYKGKISLWERADMRASRLVSDVQVGEFDLLATPERCFDSLESTTKEHDVAQVVTLVREWPRSLNFTSEFKLWNHFERWRNFSSEPPPNDRLGKHRDWLKAPFHEVWFRLFHLCRGSLDRNRDQYTLMVVLGILAYRRDIDLDLIRTLLALATNTDNNSVLTAARRVPMDTFNIDAGHTLTLNDVSNTVISNCQDHPDPAWMERQYGEEYDVWMQRKETAFRQKREEQQSRIASIIFERWPAPRAALPLPSVASHIQDILPLSSMAKYYTVKIADLRIAVENLFASKLRNRLLFERSDGLQHALNTIRCHGPPSMSLITALPPLSYSVALPPPKYKPVTLNSLLRKRSSSLINSALRELILDLEVMPIDGPKFQYIADLSGCVDAFEKKAPGTSPSNMFNSQRSLDSAPDENIQTDLLPLTQPERWMHLAGQWPSTGPQSLLNQLSRGQRELLSDHWKITLCQYAEKLAIQQQRRRISAFVKLGLTEESAREAATVGGQGWDPIAYPDWLLVQLDADILIRPLQANIAQHMMSPESHRNALMQLNMGEGKSSVIVPIISSALADGEQLVRVIVLKPLAAQMFQLLKQRVCTLANRRLFYLPFSRDVSLDLTKIRQIFDLFKECAENGGILLCQPEHVLSFKLMGLDAFSESETDEATRLLREIQSWLDSHARDILDESDEILNVRYQLIYTVGASKPLDGRPWRWQITQAIFSLLQTVAKTVPAGLEIGVAERDCQFPVVRILTPEGGQCLLDSAVQKIIAEDGLQQWISFRNYSEADKARVECYLRQATISIEEEEALRDISGEHFGHLLLVRGLFAHGILNVSLHEKRWRVDYGLDARRTMLAVPYRAKDSPAPRAEFGHPDMIIVLTCLSYYYGGLTDSQLDTSFKLLLNSDNPEAQYEFWVKGIKDLSATLANLRGLNLDDFVQKTRDVFPHLRYNKAVIDFYLSECVFPKEAREFEHKLTTNAWDLARTRSRLTTGFSGTNDNKYLLPLSIEQCDQDSQKHTNAQVLGYVLQQENRRVICTSSDNALGLLQRVVQQDPHVMVLLDVGAQVLELQNEDVAREWLKLDTRPEVEAAIYFDSSTDEIRVISRDGRIQPFASSLYKKQLGKTLVYLDEAHTRGTDFKFPGGTRAVVTLGPRLTKDKLVQGCMRMRRLGKDHSVVFFASTEIQNKIMAATGAQPDEIYSRHVLSWTIKEMCEQIQNNGSLWANQGLNFDARHRALQEYDAGSRCYECTVGALREQESRTLEELYGVASRSEHACAEATSQLQRQIEEKCKQLGITPSDSALSEEQERELAHEKEDEREVERIADAKPREHEDRDLAYFIKTGTIARFSTFISLADCLAHTSWISLLPEGRTFRGTGVCATQDFRDTIVLSSTPFAGSMDSYLRPVQWVMSTSKSSDLLILISPFEANKWLPEIRRSSIVHLHLYSPRTSRNTFCLLDRLDSFTVPAERSVPLNPELLHELNLFAGQLFCADKSSMKKLCGILGLQLQSVSDMEGVQGAVDSTGFVKTEQARAVLGLQACSFVSSPLPFFRELIGARRKGQGFSLTHMGQILRGNDPKDPAFKDEEGESSQ